MKIKLIAAALTMAALCLSALAAQRPTVSADSISDIPQEYRTACDWVWQNRIEPEGSCKDRNTVYDQIIAGNGTVQYILIWQSYETLTLAQRQKLPQMLEDALNKWNDCLVGYDDWPVEHVNVKVIGYAVLDKSVLQDLQPDEVVFTETASPWTRDWLIESGMGNSSIPELQPAEPTALSRYAHWQDKSWSYNGSYDNRFDMYLHGIHGMIDMGGVGYQYGQILSDHSIEGLLNGTTSQHILLHEMGHGFGYPDYYGGEGESDGFPPGGFPGGEGSIMMAGSCSYINTFDKYFARYTWSKLKDEAGRFDLANFTQAQTQTTAPVTETTTITTTTLTTPPVSRVPGDVNADGTLSIADVVLVQRWLLAVPGTYLPDWQAGDLNGDGRLSGADMTLIKRLLLGRQTAPQDPGTGTLLQSTVKQFGTATPSIGNVKSLNIYVDFADATYLPTAYSAEQIENELFGNGSTAAPYESITAWYERASYGNLHIDGDVYRYTCKGNMAEYSQGQYEYEKMAMEVLTGLDGQINYADYDGNHDGIIDCISFTVPLDNASEQMKQYWYGCTGTWYQNPGFSVDGVKLSSYIIMDVMPNASDMTYLKQTLIHEMGHSIGLPDYYKYDSSDYEGMHGDAGYERMDDSIGDFCSFSKLMYGWLKDTEVQSYTGSGAQSFTLADASNTGSCLILPISSSAGDYTSEYFLVEYITKSGNNADIYTNDSGVRVFHVQAQISGTSFKYDNFSDSYMGDDKIRVLRLVNDNGGFYHAGDTIRYGTSNFAAYDAGGNQTIDTGYTISIGSIENGRCTVTVTK